MHAFTTSGPGYCARSLKSVAFSGQVSPKSGIASNQFPLWFRKNRTTVGYLEQFSERLPYSISVEFRGGGWMDEDRRKSTLEILARHGLSYVVADEPQGFKSSMPQVIACTAPLAVVRFTVEMQPIGRGASVAERFKYLYSENEPKAWVKPIHTLAQQAQQVHALMNNCYADYACGTPDN